MMDFAARGHRFEDSAHCRLMCVALALWWSGFVFRSFEIISIAKDSSAAAATEQGSLANQLLIVALAALGLFHVPRAWQVMKSREGRNVTILVLLYLGWSGASLMWSEDLGLSIRRLTAFTLLMIGCYGLGAGFYSRMTDGALALARHVIYAGVIAVAILLPPRLASVKLADLLDPSFNVKDTTEIALLTYPAGYAFLAAIVVYRWRTALRWTWMGFYLAVLLFLKGRSMLGDVLASACILVSRLAQARVARGALLSLGVLQTAFYADLGTGGRLFITYIAQVYDSLAPILPWVTVGDGLQNLTSLSGRVPLWNALLDFIGQQPLTGYGFGAFWTPEHLDQIFKMVAWRAVVAHSGFLDELLATGAIGLGLFLTVWLYGMVLSVRLAQRFNENLGRLMFSWMLLYLLFNTLDSVNQAFFKAPLFLSMTGLFAMMQYYSEDEPRWIVEDVSRGELFVLESYKEAHRPLDAAPEERGTQRMWPHPASPLSASSPGTLGEIG